MSEALVTGIRFLEPNEKLLFDGERFTTGLGGQIEHEHRHRYLFAARLCRDKVVLDVASGEGYGSAFLAQFARRVVGVDLACEAISFASRNYVAPNLAYVQGSATSLPIGDRSVDVVVSFETIEHFLDHEGFMREIRRVLRPGGLLIISSPNKGIYNEGQAHNHFHVRELTREEFLGLLGQAFANVKVFEQKATTGSLLIPDSISDRDVFRTYRRMDDYGYQASDRLVRGVYSLAVASDGPLPCTEWGALEDEGYVEFLVKWIRDVDARREQAIAAYEVRRVKDTADAEARTAQAIADAEQRHALAIANAEHEHAKAIADVHLQTARLIGEMERLRRHLRERDAALAERDVRIASLTAEMARQASDFRSSNSWRLTAPLRWAGGAVRRARTESQGLPARVEQFRWLGSYAYSTVRRIGACEFARRVFRAVGNRSIGEVLSRATPVEAASLRGLAAAPPSIEYARPEAPAPEVLARRVLIVAELSLPQCAKYRVWQKKEHFECLGVPCTVVDWGHRDEVYALLQTHAGVIFYRVPGWPETLGFMAEARRLRVPSFWEVDDLIFDAEAYAANRNLDHVSADLRSSVLAGIPLYKSALQACDYGLASTAGLAERMASVGISRTFVVENALDNETLSLADVLRARTRPTRVEGEVLIGYGSGSLAHDADFLEAAEALVEVLSNRPCVRLRIVGDLNLPATLSPFASRIEQICKSSFAAYMERLWECDISIAPLEATAFNVAKSNIKFLEAAVLGLPSVCSPRAAFRSVVQDGVTGFLAEGSPQWKTKLLALCDDPVLRSAMGGQAREQVLSRYTPGAVARAQVGPILELLPQQQRRDLNVLAANVFFKPQSFGGATIVAEELAFRLNASNDTSVAVFTSLGSDAESYRLLRYQVDGVSAVAVRMPPMTDRALDYQNARMQERFSEVLKAYRPDVVHLHCVQGISASIADSCVAAGVPYVLTIHDAWWLCERQFMVREDGRYCFQSKIDLKTCATCVPDIEFTVRRRDELRRILDSASLLITPSEFHRQLHIANGIDPARIKVNRNGVRMPGPDFSRTTSDVLRFGFVGGVGPIKGIEHIRQAFLEIDRSDYELTLVDNTLNLGFTSVNAADWGLRGRVRVRPAYRQSDLDEFFGSMDVLLFPSQWKESFGLTVREALARHVWVISTDAGGAVEDIVDGVNGQIIPIGPDHGPLREAIADLLKQPDRLAGHRNPYAGSIMSYERQARALREILVDVVSSRRSQPTSEGLRG